MSYQPAAQFDESLRLRAGTAVSWGAILAGATAAIALSVLLLTLGAGLGFAAVSPWANHGAAASTVAVSGAIWLIVTQWISACVGGYLAGRLRHRWLATHQHEVFFRDTAHGLVTWALASIIVVVAVSSSLSALGGSAAREAEHGARGGMEAMHSSMGAGGAGEDHVYGVDKLFRTASPVPNGAMAMSATGATRSESGSYRMEAVHIAAKAATSGEVPADDRAYLASLVAANTGLSPEQAQQRVDAFVADVQAGVARAKADADKARKAAAQAAIYTALAMLIGAFIASVSAALGGRLRDEHL